MLSISEKKLKFYNTSKTVSIPLRKEINHEYRWDLTHIYDSDQEWERDFGWVEKNTHQYNQFAGKLHTSAEVLLACLKFNDEMGIKLDRLHLYAMLSKDSDMTISIYQAMDDRIKSLITKVTAASAFIKPELLKINDEVLLNMVNSDNELKIYKHGVDDLLRTKSHSLSKKEEEILALAAEVAQVPYNSYSMFTNADISFPVIKDDQSRDFQVSHAKFYSAMYSKDNAFRKRAFEAYLKPYEDYVNTFTTLFNGNVKANIFFAKARNYNSAREAALDKNNIPLSIYDNLIETVNQNLTPLHWWASLKKRLLKTDKLRPYDVYVTTFNNVHEKTYPYETAKEIVLNSLEVMGKEYLDSIISAFNNRWIDVYETKAKRSGAYSSGTTYGVHPYVLMNWTDLLNDVFTLAHEMGHNMHSYFTGQNQPYPYANYSIFLAEIASTFNESLLLQHLISNVENEDEKLYLLEKYLNNITATFYRQVMFAEFEKIVYEKTENGEALTPEILSKLYRDVYQKYWGPDMFVSKEEEYTWARIPHFYYNFYVYQYATGFAASEVLAAKVKKEGKSAVDRYLNFLKSGSSDYPINILKAAGIDLSSPEPILAVAEKMNSILTEMENVLAGR